MSARSASSTASPSSTATAGSGWPTRASWSRSRLHLIPRFRKRLQFVPFEQGRPIWVDDDRFDIGYHVRLTALPSPGTREQLLTLCNRVQEQLLDRSRPLWELWFVEGVEDGNIALIQKTHHALVDGVSGVDVATVLLDFTPEPTVLDPPEWHPEPPPSPEKLLIDTLRERVSEPAEIVPSARRVLRGPRAALHRAQELTGSLQTLLGRDVVAPRTSLNQRVGRHRRFEPVRIPLDDVKTVRHALGGTVNDVILAGVSGGLRRLLESARRISRRASAQGAVSRLGARRRRAARARKPGRGDGRRVAGGRGRPGRTPA